MQRSSKSVMDEAEQQSSILGVTSRRSLMSAAAKLAITAPLALAVLPSVALADGDDQGEDNDDRKRGNRFGQIGRECTVAGVAGFQRGAMALPLVPVSQVNGGTGGSDFQSGNVANPVDPLGTGEIMVNGNHQVSVAVRGAMANTQYDVRFERLWDHDRSEDPGGFTTDGNGNFAGVLGSALSGTNRVGCFVVTRNGGADEYISTWP